MVTVTLYLIIIFTLTSVHANIDVPAAKAVLSFADADLPDQGSTPYACYTAFRQKLCLKIGKKNIKKCMSSIDYEITDQAELCKGFACLRMYTFCDAQLMQQYQVNNYFLINI